MEHMLLGRYKDLNRRHDDISAKLDSIIARNSADDNASIKHIEHEYLIGEHTKDGELAPYSVTRVTVTARNVHFPCHVHESGQETIICVQGRVAVTVGAHLEVLTEGRSLYVPADMLHGGYSLTDYAQVLIVCVPPDEATLDFSASLKSVKKGKQ